MVENEKLIIETESDKLDKWNSFIKEAYNLPDRIKLVDIDKKNNSYLKYILIAFGLLLIALSIFYGSYYDKFKSDVICSQNVTIPKCPDIPANPSCPSCPSCSLSCGNTTINPIIYTNGSG